MVLRKRFSEKNGTKTRGRDGKEEEIAGERDSGKKNRE